MSFTIKISTSARLEISEVVRWYQLTSGSIEIAQSWYDGLIDSLGSLRNDPGRYALASESDAFPFELRQMLYGSGHRTTHRILFRIVEREVEILCVRHVAQQDLLADDVADLSFDY